MARLKMETSVVTTTVSNTGALNSSAGTTAVVTSGNVAGVTTLSLGQMDCYEDMFKEITKKLYGEDGLAEVIDPTGVAHSNILYDPDAATAAALAAASGGGGLTLVTSTGNGLPPGSFVVHRRIHDEKVEPISVSGLTAPVQVPSVEERWFDSEEILSWTTSKIARYNPAQKVFRCVDCDFVGFLSRVAEHWLGNHASLRVFQCPRCPYTSAWARCVRMHLTRQHGETLTDNSLWKENPVLEEVTKFLNTLKTKVEQKGEASDPGAKRYTCPFCPYATDRRDLFNRHENIHRDEKPFQCYVCEKQFNRADHVKKHFMRMHRDHNYDINRIRKNIPKSHGGAVPFFSNRINNTKLQQPQQHQQQQQQQHHQQQPVQNIICEPEPSVETTETVALHLQTSNNQSVSLQQIPHLAYFNPPVTPGQTGPLQGIQGVGGIKKEVKAKGAKKKKNGDKMYTCSYCPWQGVDNWCLKRHLNTHIKPFLCALCDYKAARSERLATHVLKVHNKRVCHKCSFLADDLESLNQHIQDSHQNPLVKTGFNCNVCQEYFELRADLEAHAILEHQKVIVQCDLCDFRTTDEISMEAHLREKHNLQPGMGAVAAAAAAAAAAAGTPQPQLQMAQQQPIIQLQALHEQVPVVEQHQQADPSLIVPDQMDASIIEGVTFSSEESQLQKLDQTVPEEEVVPEVEPETLCELCGFEFVNEESFRVHEKVHEYQDFKDDYEVKTSKEISRSFVCSTCSYTSCTKNNMLQHLRAHTGFLMECRAENCQFASPFENSLKEHIQLEHNDDHSRSSVRCPHCGTKLSSLRNFTLHWRFHHAALCSLCVNVYKVKFGMKEAGIHDLVLKNPLSILNDGVEEEEKQAPEIDQDSMTGTESLELTDREKLAEAVLTQKINDALCQAINGVNNNSSKKFMLHSSSATASTMTPSNKTPETDENECSEPCSKKMRLINHILPSLSADVLNSGNNVVNRDALRFLPKLIELLVVPLCRLDEDRRAEERGWKHLSRHSLLKYPYTCYKEPHVVPKHVFNFILLSKHMMMSRGFKCHRLKCRYRRFKRKSTYHLHCLWNHCTRRFRCDTCDETFKYFYQAFLHKLRVHSLSPPPSSSDSHTLTHPAENTIHLQLRQSPYI